jgi:hypothetical protein
VLGLEFKLEAVSNVGLMLIRMIKQQPLLPRISTDGFRGLECFYTIISCILLMGALRELNMEGLVVLYLSSTGFSL